MTSPRPLQFSTLFTTTLTLGLAGFWIWSGTTKLLDWATFSEIAAAHNVLPNAAIEAGVLWAVPVSELLVGFLIVAFGHRSSAKWLILVLAAIMLATYSTYILLIPTSALKVVGCGCRGSRAPIESPLWPLVLNGGTLALHLLINVLPPARPRPATNDAAAAPQPA